jgi:Asp-tRNA(Asn)/Glu-tRNA(Gln) amidotransferase A subunit family amidase
VPAFILAGDGIPFHGIPSIVPEPAFEKLRTAANMPLRPETRAAFMKAVDALRAAGAEVVIDDTILPLSFAKSATRVADVRLHAGRDQPFLATFGPPEYHSAADYLKAVGQAALHVVDSERRTVFRTLGGVRIDQRVLEKDPDAERTYHAPRARCLRVSRDASTV